MCTAPSSARDASVWIQNPTLDFVVGCGAWSAPLLAFAYLTSAGTTAIWSIVFYGLALFFNYPHYMATIYRAYHDRENFEKYRFFTIYVTAAFLVLLVACHAYVQMLPWIFTLYLTWSPWHYSGQNYGILMMFGRRAGVQVTALIRRLLYASFLISYAVLFLSLHTGPSSDPLFLTINLPERVGMPLIAILSVAFLICAVAGLRGLLRQSNWKGIAAPTVLMTTQLMWFVLPSFLRWTSGWQIPQGRYSTGVLAIMHSAQYLWITHYYQRREANAQGLTWKPVAYFGALMVGGIALFVPGPWISAYVFHKDFRNSFLVFTALVNLHHFVLDGAIWKLRDGKIASMLLATRDSAAALTKRAAAVGQGGGWRRPVQLALAVVLIGWAVLDQTRNLWVARADSIPSLVRAANLNPFDSGLQQKIAQLRFEAGDETGALQAWIRAAELDPSKPGP